MAASIDPKIKRTGIWVLRALVAIAFLASAGLKLAGAPGMVEDFTILGLGQWLRIVTGAIEAAGVVLVLVPGTSRLGGLVLLAICVGVFLTRIFKLHGDLTHVAVLFTLTALVAWSGPPVTRLLFGGRGPGGRTSLEID
ncbi:MAG: DoxX family protein [Beijerinckiaceae bacterium]|nr:DoxX family protein [Beijerinckiaceae bacterium]